MSKSSAEMTMIETQRSVGHEPGAASFCRPPVAVFVFVPAIRSHPSQEHVVSNCNVVVDDVESIRIRECSLNLQTR